MGSSPPLEQRRSAYFVLPSVGVAHRFERLPVRSMLLLALWGAMPSELVAQVPSERAAVPVSGAEADLSLVLTHVDVEPVAHDEQIRARLKRILDATGSFTDPNGGGPRGRRLPERAGGDGRAQGVAGELARSTQDVVAVANRMEVLEPSVLDFGPARSGLRDLWRDFVHALPALLFGLVTLALSAGAGGAGDPTLARDPRPPGPREPPPQRDRPRRGHPGLPVRLLHRPACVRSDPAGAHGGGRHRARRPGPRHRLSRHHRELPGQHLSSASSGRSRRATWWRSRAVTGYVQQLNVRTTILMTLDGTLVQIPNASVYKSNIRNFTTNANRREDFVVGIGYDDPINEAQEIARQVLVDHPAVLSDPEPSVLADSMGQATINLRVYFWLDGREHSWLKVRSSVIRLVKLAFQQHGISMPDEAREIIFPRGNPDRAARPHANSPARRRASGPGRGSRAGRARRARAAATARRRARCHLHQGRGRAVERGPRDRGAGPSGQAAERGREPAEGGPQRRAPEVSVVPAPRRSARPRDGLSSRRSGTAARRRCARWTRWRRRRW
jgi:small conductance mechanosensitive channel